MLDKSAVLFPGQGSQALGMLEDVYTQQALFKETLSEASSVLGFDVFEIIKSNEQKLNQTEFTQPILLACSVGLWRILNENKFEPTLLAGHSLGEYSALVCAKALDFHDALKLVSLRGRLMQNAVPEGSGAMAAIIGLDEEKLKTLCENENKLVIPANYNSPGQVVISGEKDAVHAVIKTAKEAGAKMAVELPVSVPSHCDLMKEAAVQLEEALADIHIEAPHIPVVNNVYADIEANPERIKENLVQQLYSPVQWVKTMAYMQTNNIEELIECGPGKVLLGLAKRCNKQFKLFPTNTNESLALVLKERS